MNQATNYLPQTFEFSIGGTEGGNRSEFKFKDGILWRYTRTCGQEAPHTTHRSTPDRIAWLHFWQAIESLGVWDWQSTYNDSNILDGWGWSLQLKYGNRTLTTRGDNDCPEAVDNDYESDGVFGRFLKTVEELSGAVLLR